MSTLETEIIMTDRKVSEIMESGYSRAEALQLIHTAAISKLADCVQTGYNGKTYLNITGNVTTYEQ